MNIKILKSGLLVVLISALIAVLSIVYTNINSNQRNGGELVFANAYKHINDIGSIVIKDNSKTITLLQEDNLWRVKESDYYYADYVLVNGLFTDFNTSKFYRKIDNNPENIANIQQSHSLITIFSKDNKILDEMMIGAKEERNVYNMAIPITNPENLYLITGKYFLPQNDYAWLQQPLLQLEDKQIQSIETDFSDTNKKIIRDNPLLPFINFLPNKISKEVDATSLERELKYIGFTKVISAQNFDETLFSENKKYKITTFEGLVINLTILSNNTDYWAKINLSSTNLPTMEVNDYIEDNSFLYDGWYFKLNSNTGRIIFNFTI